MGRSGEKEVPGELETWRTEQLAMNSEYLVNLASGNKFGRNCCSSGCIQVRRALADAFLIIICHSPGRTDRAREANTRSDAMVQVQQQKKPSLESRRGRDDSRVETRSIRRDPKCHHVNHGEGRWKTLISS
jgi:hypothetical protein